MAKMLDIGPSNPNQWCVISDILISVQDIYECTHVHYLNQKVRFNSRKMSKIAKNQAKYGHYARHRALYSQPRVLFFPDMLVSV